MKYLVPQAGQLFCKDERGSIAVLSGLLLTVLLGFGALSVDVSSAWNIQAKLQATADASALAASQQLPDSAAARTAALDLVSRNIPSTMNWGTVVASADVEVGSYDATTKAFSAGSGTTAVRVTASRTSAKGNQVRTFLAGITGWHSSDVKASAIAYRLKNSPAYCVIVLDGSAVSALGVTGGGNFSVPNCGVYVNSTHNKAASAGNATTVTARNFCIAGGYNGSFSPTPVTGCPAIADPLSSIAEPTMPTTACMGYTYSGSNCYWTGNITISGNQTISGSGSDILFFKNATVSIASGANLSSSGTMWYFDSSSSLTFGGNGTVNITAPTSGTYKGISIFQSRSATLNNTAMKLTGSSNFVLDGTIYVPRGDLQMSGTSDVTVNSKTGYVIANKVSYTGASTFTVGTWGGVQALGSNTPAYLVQ